MQFSLRYDGDIWELTDHEKEVTILAIHWEIKAKFHTVPIDFNGFRSSFTPFPIVRARRGRVYYNSKLHNYLTDYFMMALKWFMNFTLVDIKVIYHAS